MKIWLSIFLSFIFSGYSFAAGSVSGTITFDGDAPKFNKIRMEADPICLTHNPTDVYPESIVVGEGKGLANVIVSITNAPKETYPIPAEEVIIDQKGCNYQPHVVLIRAGQKIKILNPDGTMHNVHAMSKVNQGFNLAMPKFRTSVEKVFDKAESPFALKCDVHPWMTAWIMVTDNPFNAVTDNSGHFEIKNLPTGTYDINVWHERLGNKNASVTVTDNNDVKSDFIFSNR